MWRAIERRTNKCNSWSIFPCGSFSFRFEIHCWMHKNKTTTDYTYTTKIIVFFFFFIYIQVLRYIYMNWNENNNHLMDLLPKYLCICFHINVALSLILSKLPRFSFLYCLDFHTIKICVYFYYNVSLHIIHRLCDTFFSLLHFSYNFSNCSTHVFKYLLSCFRLGFGLKANEKRIKPSPVACIIYC